MPRSVETRESFSFAHQCHIVAAGEKYNASHYGSNLWDLRSKSAEIVHATGEPTASWSGNFLSKQSIASFINLFATDATSPRTVKAAKFALWPDLHQEILDPTCPTK